MQGVGDWQVEVEGGEEGPELGGEGDWKGNGGLGLVLYCADAGKSIIGIIFSKKIIYGMKKT